ncbi:MULTISPECIES: hypothetical protein [Streptomyces]|uniref:hypothetical protein n=1 Tax=Streptomyces TaxID=1883 RepID=UPI0031E00850
MPQDLPALRDDDPVKGGPPSSTAWWHTAKAQALQAVLDATAATAPATDFPAPA